RETDARRHEKLERELEQALDQSAPRDELERVFYVIDKAGRGLSAPLEARYQARLKEIDGAARRKKNLLKIGAAAAAVLVVVLSSWLVYRSALAGRLREAREALQAHLEAKHVAEARALLGELEKSDPAVYNHADFAAVRAQFLEA